MRRRTAEIRRLTRGGDGLAFGLISGHFRPEFDLGIVLENDPGIVIVLALKFGDHRRWSDPACVQCTRRRLGRRVRLLLVVGFGLKIPIFDYGYVGVCFGEFCRSLGFYVVVYRSVTERKIF